MRSLIFLIFIGCLFYQKAHAINDLDDFAEDFNLTSNEARHIAGKIAHTIREVQASIIFIGDSNNGYTEKIGKYGAINTAVENLFKTEYSLVYVSSLYRDNVTSSPVRRYLQKLALLASGAKYKRVSISFGKELLVEGVRKESDNDADINIGVWQGFKGCAEINNGEEEYCYSDVTRKIIEVDLQINRRDIYSSEIKVDNIYVKDTFRYEDKAHEIIWQ